MFRVKKKKKKGCSKQCLTSFLSSSLIYQICENPLKPGMCKLILAYLLYYIRGSSYLPSWVTSANTTVAITLVRSMSWGCGTLLVVFSVNQSENLPCNLVRNWKLNVKIVKPKMIRTIWICCQTDDIKDAEHHCQQELMQQIIYEIHNSSNRCVMH